MMKLRRFPGYMRNPAVQPIRKVGVVVALLYIVSPFDAVSDFLPVLGWLDDAGVFTALLLFMQSEMRKQDEARARRELDEQ